MSNSIDSVLSSVMGNEELMNKIRDTVKSKNGDTTSSLEEVISLIAPTLNNTQNEDKKESSTDTVQVESKKADTSDTSIKEREISSFLSTFSHTISRNTGLLIALKPYLNNERCQMIDGVVKISKLAEVLKLL